MTEETFHQQWRQFKTGKPGHRFQDHYQRQRRRGKGQNSNWNRILLWLGALISFAVGFILVFIPGPAVVFFFVTGALLAAESRVVAIFMDWAEIKVRALVNWIRRTWRKMSGGAKAAAVVVAGGMGAGFAYLSYQFFVAR